MVTAKRAFSVVLMPIILAGLGLTNPEAEAAGYVARPCGLDLNRNGVIGKPGLDDVIARGPTGRQGFSAADSKKMG